METSVDCRVGSPFGLPYESVLELHRVLVLDLACWIGSEHTYVGSGQAHVLVFRLAPESELGVLALGSLLMYV